MSVTYPLSSIAVLCCYVDPHCGNTDCFQFLKSLNKAEVITSEHGDGCLNSKGGGKMKLLWQENIKQWSKANSKGQGEDVKFCIPSETAPRGAEVFGRFTVTFFILILFVCFRNGERWGKTARLVSPTERLWSFYAKAVGLEMGFYTLRVLKGDPVIPAEEEKNSGDSQPELTKQEITVFPHC